jgi:hypothetical protein
MMLAPKIANRDCPFPFLHPNFVIVVQEIPSYWRKFIFAAKGTRVKKCLQECLVRSKNKDDLHA